MDSVELLQGDWDARVLAARCGETVTCFAVVTQTLLVVVDTMLHPASGAAWRGLLDSSMAQRSLLVVNTHGDWDHYWGNQAFAAPILGTPLCAARVRAEGAATLSRKQGEEPGRFDDVRLVAPNVLVDTDARLEGGDLTLQFIPTPGHQPDQVAVWIPELRLLLAADAAEEPFPLVDDPQGLPELRRSLQRLRDLQPEWVLACHAAPERGPGLLERNLAYFERLEQGLDFPEAESWSDFYRDAHLRAQRASALSASL